MLMSYATVKCKQEIPLSSFKAGNLYNTTQLVLIVL